MDADILRRNIDRFVCKLKEKSPTHTHYVSVSAQFSRIIGRNGGTLERKSISAGSTTWKSPGNSITESLELLDLASCFAILRNFD